MRLRCVKISEDLNWTDEKDDIVIYRKERNLTFDEDRDNELLELKFNEMLDAYDKGDKKPLINYLIRNEKIRRYLYMKTRNLEGEIEKIKAHIYNKELTEEEVRELLLMDYKE